MDLGDMSIDLAVASCMFRIKQNPEIYLKLMEELRTNGVIKAIKDKNISMPMMAKCEYLNYVIKESLRIDPPTITSHPYQAFKDTSICGVEIPESTKIQINYGNFNTLISLAACHFNPKQWHEPEKFIPERFDPSSDYFTVPGTGKFHPNYV